MKFWEVYRFELYYQLRRPSTWIYFLAVLGLVFLVIDEVVDYTRTVGGALLHAPVTVANITGYSNKFGLLLLAMLAGNGAMRDIQARMDPLMYTTSLSKSVYLGARFLGTFTIAIVLMLMVVPLDMTISSFAMNAEAELYGLFNPVSYINSALFLTVPNVFVATAVLYAMVLLSRQAMAAYLGALLIFVLSTFNMDVLAENWALGKLVDPTGLTVVDEWRRALTPNQINTSVLRLEGSLLANRALWICISLLLGVVAYSRFQLSHHLPDSWWKRNIANRYLVPVHTPTAPAKAVTFLRTFDYKTRLYQTRSLAYTFYQEITKSPVGLAIPAIAVYAFILIPNMSEGPLGVPILPTTPRIILFLNNAALQIFVVMLITLLAGQLIWRERDSRLHEIFDAVPVPDGVLLWSKYLCLALVLFTVQAALLVASISIQLVAGYYQFEIGEYLQALFGVQLLDQLLFAAVAMTIHTLVNQKYVGHLLVLLFYLYTLIAPRLGIEHNLFIFGSDPGLAGSVFYGQGSFLFPWLLFKLYWIAWALLFMMITQKLWVRGRETTIKYRLRQSGKGLMQSPVLIGAITLLMVTGTLIFYNTNILNKYTTAEERVEQQVLYEQLYGRYRAVPQPLLTSTRLQVEFYPDERMAVVQGIYTLKNDSRKAIDSIHLATAPVVETRTIKFSRDNRAVLTDKKLGHHIYVLNQPLLPGDSVQVSYEVGSIPEGFSNRGITTSVMNNGSYFRNSEWLPAIGYQPFRELRNDRKRKDYDLPQRPEFRPLHDAESILSRTGREQIQFEATIGTAADQIAVAPGTLTKSWKRGDRQYFRYVADRPIQNMFHVYSARYQVRKARWQNVDIQIFHHPTSVLNLDRIERGIKASLDYYTRTLSPYPHRQLKFVEYPDPGTGGISLPGTIGYSTNFALLNPANDTRGFDLLFAVVAHEVAHQWWGHQLVPAEVEGSALLTESLAWYSALGVVEQAQGPEQLQNLLDAMRHEYLNPRSRAAVPLLKARDSFQAYRKGPFAMYALREYVGEEPVNRALRNLLTKFKPGVPPFATSLDFYSEMKAVTPDPLHYLLKDLFETNTFWELVAKGATAKPTADGAWLVTMDLLAHKVQVDTTGVETEVSMNDLIEVGIWGKSGMTKPLYLKKEKIRSGMNRLTIKVSEQPEEVGIDPRHLLIDTEMYDNSRQVVIEK
ncbi:ABC transporter permease/M1 family aminopeptidase [Telluribacter humicola]|uniref:ABC transporter permease/M1 family aminopeptidase n=1 Tax=Telluribacter humicola TaxID=1720261 RepID=UPI001A966EBE|nr:M1 family aminopeptidase [Telluribacter humicola]